MKQEAQPVQSPRAARPMLVQRAEWNLHDWFGRVKTALGGTEARLVLMANQTNRKHEKGLLTCHAKSPKLKPISSNLR